MFAPQVLLHLYNFVDAQAKMTQMPLMNIYYCLGQFILDFITVITFFLNLRLAACGAPEIWRVQLEEGIAAC